MGSLDPAQRKIRVPCADPQPFEAALESGAVVDIPMKTHGGKGFRGKVIKILRDKPYSLVEFEIELDS